MASAEEIYASLSPDERTDMAVAAVGPRTLGLRADVFSKRQQHVLKAIEQRRAKLCRMGLLRRNKYTGPLRDGGAVLWAPTELGREVGLLCLPRESLPRKRPAIRQDDEPPPDGEYVREGDYLRWIRRGKDK